MMSSAILISVLIMLLSFLHLFMHLICSSSLSCLRNLYLTFKTLCIKKELVNFNPAKTRGDLKPMGSK